MPNKIQPTAKQRIAAEKFVENSRTGKKSKGDILREANYAEATVIKPHIVLESRGFKQALAEIFTPEYKQAKYKELTEATKVISAQVFPDGKDGKPVNDFIEVPDYRVQLDTLKDVNKLQGEYPAEEHNVKQVVSFEAMSVEQLTQIVERGKKLEGQH